MIKSSKRSSSNNKNRSGIALLITLFFVIAITASIGISLGQVNNSLEKISGGRFITQSSAVLEDVSQLLKTSPEMELITDATSLNLFLTSAAIIPFEVESLRVFIEMKSARGKFNINTLADSVKLQQEFEGYLQRYNVQDGVYLIDLFIDSIKGKQELYRSDLFDYMPWLYREGFVDEKHLQEVIDFYVRSRHDGAIYDVPWEKVIRFGENNDTALDVNYMSAEMWQMVMPQMQIDSTIELADHLEVFETLEDTGFTPDELNAPEVKIYNLGTYAPQITVTVDIEDNNESSSIKFEYDITTKKGKQFEFNI
jgi:hypothetical protein